MKKYPKWLRKPLNKDRETFNQTEEVIKKKNLTTVCQEAHCPNLGECWGSGSVTFMILGNACTRSCNFCAVASEPLEEPDPQEPMRLANAVEELGLTYVVITSVTRDDLPDQGAGHYADCIRAIKEKLPKVKVEALIPDFQCEEQYLQKIVKAKPEVIGHNIETVKRLQERVRDPRAGYEQSLHVLERIKRMDKEIYTKSSLMLGLGETEEEVFQTMEDLREAEVDILTLGQYLRPSEDQLEVQKYIPPEQFERLKKEAEKKGFLYVVAGPFVRSSYKSAELFCKNVSNAEKC